MINTKILTYIDNVLKNLPSEWLNITTHRLDIYNEKLAKIEFLNFFDELYEKNDFNKESLRNLPTAYDYIRLGHPLSCILEWTIAKIISIHFNNVISFSSKTAPILAVLRKNLIENKKTQILYKHNLPQNFDIDTIKDVYGYEFETIKINNQNDIKPFEGSTIYLTNNENIRQINFKENIDFYVNVYDNFGSVILLTNTSISQEYIVDIQHFRRRETISMTPNDCHQLLKCFFNCNYKISSFNTKNKLLVKSSIQKISNSSNEVLVGSSGLSTQYAIMMGLVEYASKFNPNKQIKFIVPSNCYGGTNDQARRVSECFKNVEVVDLLVDGNDDMVNNIDSTLEKIAFDDAIPYIITEIPTNPRVEVPDLEQLRKVLTKKRITKTGQTSVSPVFVLDQTFCPNVQFIHKDSLLSNVKVISYVSGSKFPSGGKCTVGYCIANDRASNYIEKISKHLNICDNEATQLQYEVLASKIPSMNSRIQKAYINTLDFVNFIKDKLPKAKINFVSNEVANQGFTPSVFSLDLPTKGKTYEEKEEFKRELNLKLINLMITEIPNESKYCVSYGQLKGSYWTIPATSTQGTTKERDKDYIVRISVSGDLNLEKHKNVFMKFVKEFCELD